MNNRSRVEMELKRISQNESHPTFGVLLNRGLPFAVTLERPWRQNRRGISCIPSGTYRCVRCSASPDYGFRDSPNFGNTFQVYNVPERSKILFHKGNVNQDTHGCIIVGEQYDYLQGENAVLSSRKGFEEFLKITQHVDEFFLEITNHF